MVYLRAILTRNFLLFNYPLIQFIFFYYEKTLTNAEATVIAVTKMEYVQIHLEVIAVSVPTDTVAMVERA